MKITAAVKLEKNDLGEEWVDLAYCAWRKLLAETMTPAAKKRFLAAIKKGDVSQDKLFRATYLSDKKFESMLAKQSETLNKFPYYAFTTREGVNTFYDDHDRYNVVGISMKVKGYDLNGLIKKLADKVAPDVDMDGKSLIENMFANTVANKPTVIGTLERKFAGRNTKTVLGILKLIRSKNIRYELRDYLKVEPEWIVEGPIKFGVKDIVRVKPGRSWYRDMSNRSIEEKLAWLKKVTKKCRTLPPLPTADKIDWSENLVVDVGWSGQIEVLWSGSKTKKWSFSASPDVSKYQE